LAGLAARSAILAGVQWVEDKLSGPRRTTVGALIVSGVVVPVWE
jgi:hypothetical protein